MNDQLERIVQLMAERQSSRREQVAVKVADRFLLVQAEDIIYASLAEESINIVTGQSSGTSNYRTLDELQARLDPERVLAGAPVAPGQHQQDQGDRPLVQPELHPQDEGREGDGDPGQPLADAAPAGISEAVERLESGGQPSAAQRRSSSCARPRRDGRFDPATGRAPPPRPRRRSRPDAAPIRRRSLDPSMRSGWLELWRDEFVAWFKTLASAAVYATLIVTFGFQVARVEGQSMAPTLADQDRLIVNKLAYRLGEPQRGDIVMLYYPLNPDKSFVKRVIAEEGDTVRIVDGRVYVNDVPMRDDYVPAEYRSHDDWGPQVIPEGYYFVMGDHRNNSSDSRHWGFVPKRTSSARCSCAGGRCPRSSVLVACRVFERLGDQGAL